MVPPTHDNTNLFPYFPISSFHSFVSGKAAKDFVTKVGASAGKGGPEVVKALMNAKSSDKDIDKAMSG